jgi:hypothetical protein
MGCLHVDGTPKASLQDAWLRDPDDEFLSQLRQRASQRLSRPLCHMEA